MDTSIAETWQWLADKRGNLDPYLRDTYFRESWADAQTALGAHTERTLRRVVVVVFKPDAVVMRQIGFLYEAKRPTLDHVAVNDLYLGATDSFTVIFHDTTPAPTHTASTRLDALKDTKDPNAPPEDFLRSFTRAPNNMLSIIHVPEEPADMVREIGLMRDREERLALFALLGDAVAQERDTTAAVEAAMTALYADTTAETLDVSASLGRLEASLQARGATDHAADPVTALREMVGAVRHGEALPWQPFVDALAVARIELPLWDRILIGSQYIQRSEPM